MGDEFVFKEKISLCSNRLAPMDTFDIKDNKIGCLADPSSNNQFVEEYEAKQTKQRRFDQKFKLLNDEYYFKYFFNAVADNNIQIVQQLLSFGRDKDEDQKKK